MKFDPIMINNMINNVFDKINKKSLVFKIQKLFKKLEKDGSFKKAKKKFELKILSLNLQSKISEFYENNGSDEQLQEIINIAKTDVVLKS